MYCINSLDYLSSNSKTNIFKSIKDKMLAQHQLRKFHTIKITLHYITITYLWKQSLNLLSVVGIHYVQGEVYKLQIWARFCSDSAVTSPCLISQSSATEAEVGLKPGPQIRAGMSWPIRSHLVSHVTSCPPIRAHLDGEQQPAGHLSVVVGRGEGLGQLQVKHVLGTVSRV